MPQSIQIKTSTVRLLVNDDPNRVIEFNPEDISFIDAFYGLIQEFDAKMNEFKQRELVIRKNKAVDKFGIPLSTKEEIKLTKDLCAYLREKIDALFGDGTSDAAFGRSNTPDMFVQFFDGITPFIQTARKKKVAKYTASKPDESGVLE